jgi:dihydrofolate reductase
MKISMIVAHGKNREIGLDNKLLWHFKTDLLHFKKMTTGKIILMGRKTYESIGKPLPNRVNIVLTRDQNFNAAGIDVIHSPEMLFDYVLNREGEDENLEAIICGGDEIYNTFLPHTQTIYRTLVNFEGKADTFFPEINISEWEIVNEEKVDELIFQTLERI